MVVSSPTDFQAAVRKYRFEEFSFEGEAVARAGASVADAGLLVVGEPHGVHQTPGVLYSLAVALGTRGVAFEWAHEEMDETVQDFVAGGSFDFERLWSLPPSAEFFCGEGRLAAGHFALLGRLRGESRLDQVIAYDRLDPEPVPEWQVRDRDMAERLLAEWHDDVPLLVLTGAFHARRDVDEGETMAMHLARRRPGVQPAMLEYEDRPPMPTASITLRLPQATAAAMPSPGLKSAGGGKT